MNNESKLKLIAGILLVYPECTQDLLTPWIEQQARQGKTLEELYNGFSSGHLRFSVVDGVLSVEKNPSINPYFFSQRGGDRYEK